MLASEPEQSDFLLDTSALAALGSRELSLLISGAPLLGQRLYTPVTCVDAADRLRPGIARHVARIPIEPLDLTYADVLDLRERAPSAPLDVAHVISLARTGLIVVTVLPGRYSGFDLRIYPLGDR